MEKSGCVRVIKGEVVRRDDPVKYFFPARRLSRCYGRGAAPRVGAAKSSEFGEESCEHFRWTHLEQVQYCTDLSHQVAFPAHTEQGKVGPGLG